MKLVLDPDRKILKLSFRAVTTTLSSRVLVFKRAAGKSVVDYLIVVPGIVDFDLWSA